MVVGVCKIDFLIHDNHSLKGKRRVVKTIIGKVKSRFNLSIAEVDHNDLWQKGSIGISIIGNDRNVLNSMLDKILNYIESLNLVDIVDHSFEIIHL
jgi:uncharacterized protein YlxP (DUF503 family)